MPNIPVSALITIIVVVVLLFTMLLVILTRYRRCPSDKVLVIYGKVGTNKDGSARSAKCVHGGAAFIWPVIQSYEYLDLTPISINVDLTNALSHQNIRVDVPSRFTGGYFCGTGRYAERGGTPARTFLDRNPGACERYHFRSAPFGNRDDEYRGNQYGP